MTGTTHLRRGFSLLEITCTLFVLTAGLFSAITVFHRQHDHARTLMEKTIALDAAANEIELLRAAPFDSYGEGNLPPRGAHPALDRLHNAELRLHVRATDMPALREVTAHMRWTGAGGRTIEAALTTLIADRSRP
jgi:hypothetical protein